MIDAIEEQPLIALADDDTDSARTLLRTLAELGLRRVKWHGDAERSLRLFAETFREEKSRWPSLIVVDLKSSASATADFIRTLLAMASTPLLIAAMAPNLERGTRNALIDAGATAVFESGAEPGAYQREIASLVGFLDRHLTEAGSLAHDDDNDVQFVDFTIGTNASPTQDPEQGAQ
jgi:CheY-like chemotaxis protein